MLQGNYALADEEVIYENEEIVGVKPLAKSTREYHDGLVNPPIVADELDADLVFICAETGMGKTYVTSAIVRKAARNGMKTVCYRFEGITSERACNRLVRSCRDLIRRMQPDEKLLVVIDGVASPDEIEAHDEARAIEKLVHAGAHVIVCLRPESRQLMENVGNSVNFTNQDLLFRQCGEEGVSYDLTGGIPQLVAAMRADRRGGSRAEGLGVRFLTTLERLIDKTLRDGLCDEEQKNRLAMLMLGSGHMEDVAFVTQKCDEESFGLLAYDAPVFGIDPQQKTFSCHAMSKNEVLERCASPIRRCAHSYPDMVPRVCSVLASRGDYSRSAMIAKLCASESDLMSICSAWGVLYASIGEGAMVSDAMRMTRSLGHPIGFRTVLSDLAALSLMGTARQLDGAWESLARFKVETAAEVRLYQYVVLFGACRNALRYPKHAAAMVSPDVLDAPGLACLSHLRLVRLLTCGRFQEAYALISNEMLLRDPESIFEALVCDDLWLAISLSGGVPDVKERHAFACADVFYRNASMTRMRKYHEATRRIPGILMAGESDTKCIEDAASAAERAGDGYFQALCLAVCAVADIRTRALSRAHVRAEKAAEMARALGEGYLASSAELLDALARGLLGEVGLMGAYAEDQSHPEELALLGRALAHALGEDWDGGAAFELPMGTPCPQGAMWLLNLLERDCCDVWEALMTVVPTAWGDLLRATRARRASLYGKNSIGSNHAGLPDAWLKDGLYLEQGRQGELLPAVESSGLVRVSVMGGFAVECNGTIMPDGTFERRRSRDLIMLLAVAPGHNLRRYQASRTLWPHESSSRANRRLCEAAGEARKRLGEGCSGVNVLPADRSQGTLGFDTSLVSFDVDDFEIAAKQLLGVDGDDFKVLELAGTVERMYGTGPDARLIALGENVTDRLEILKTLYVDAMVASGEAALRLGKAKLASRYGMEAHRVGDLREDAMVLVARSLKAAGRGFEVAAIFRQFTRHVIEVTGVAPSRALRRSVALALGSDIYSA